MKNNNELEERIQRCLNPNCGAGVNRGSIHIKHDEKGDYIECPKCGAKHKVKHYPIIPGEGVQSSIDGLRD